MWYSYRTLLKDNNSWESLEYKIMDLADKLDAHGEVCHELFNGNEEFLRKVYYKWYGDIDLFEGTYNRSFERLQKLERTVNISLSFLEQISSAQEMLWSKTVQSVEDIQAIQTDYSFYKFWLDLQLENFSEADLEKLYIKSNGNIS